MRRLFAFLVIWAGSACAPYASGYYGYVTHIDRHGIRIASNGYPFDQVMFEEEVERVWTLWSHAFYHEKVDCSPSFDGIYVSWQPKPFEVNGKRYLGMVEDLRNAVWGGGYIVARVSYEEPYSASVLGHELGHVILLLCGLPFYDDDLEEWYNKYPTIPF